jgi:hypothetical protein
MATPGGTVISGARVTLFSANLRFFRETRSGKGGAFEFLHVPAGTYQIGASAEGREYQETTVIVTGISTTLSLNLPVEAQLGRWSIIGNTAPELLDGTGSGSLLPTGEVFMCHDTLDPIMFEPVSRTKWTPPSSGSAQGCHIATLNTDGRLMLSGDSMGESARRSCKDNKSLSATDK